MTPPAVRRPAWAACCLVGGLLVATAAAELPGRGLILHWDAAEQARLRREHSQPPIGPGMGVDTLVDASGAGRQGTQSSLDCRPLWVGSPDAAYWRFDGQNDHLSAAPSARLTAELTLFVLAAPAANAGGFSALFSTSAAGFNDFTHGLNIDFGPAPTPDLSVVNVESAGSAGMKDLLVPNLLGPSDRPFGGWHVFTVRSQIGPGGTEFFFDGLKSGDRDRLESQIGLDRMVLGARQYSHDVGAAPFAQGFFHGGLAAVLAYDRALPEAERAAVEEALLARRPALEALASGAAGHGLETLEDPPLVQMLAPGFSVDEVPLKLGNLTSIRYRHDGKCLALGYDGRLHLLSDTTGDGMPDTAEVWWDKALLKAPIGMELLPADDPRGEGVFVASKSKLSLLLDKDRDGQAEEEIVAATGWPESFHGVDVLGVARHPQDGSIYFSIGCTNFADGYLKDAQGKAQYDLASPRGTVQRLSADLKHRETVCTGVRFLCALAFNKHGDLFATDQEGATWLPNGNPFDELLHIVPGRHYGFPPRHPRHLPDVLDEPSTFDYGPQHQSTCGMVFNDGVNGGPAFGPAHWHGDAIVCGESRGKLWRTKLALTPEGYVAQTHLIACLNLLTVDACVTPSGDLLVACHSGPPDWGTGPAGDGRLFRIRWENRAASQPVVAWAAAPGEFRIAFDQPLHVEDWRGAAKRTRIETGAYVAPGDRFETVRPGYQVVRDQMASPRRWVDVLDLSLTADGRTLVLRVPPQTSHEPYAVTLPVPESWQAPSGVPQIPEMDVAVTLHGVSADGLTLPHPSRSVSRILTAGSAEHEAALAKPGALTVKTKVDVTNLFQPKTQPGSTLDYIVETDPFASRRMSLLEPVTGHRQEFTVSLPEVTVPLSGEQRLALAMGTHIRPAPLNRFFLPWSSNEKPSTPTGPVARTDVSGNWLHGRRLYFGKAACFTCHTMRGEGMECGPDLTNLIHRDRDSVWADMANPSATINPDHAASLVELNDGSSLTGIIVTTNNEKLTLALPAGARRDLAQDAILKVSPLRASLMPDGMAEALSSQEQEDLLTFLLTVPLEPVPITRTAPAPPPPRPRAEIAPFLPPPGQVPAAARKLNILLCAGPKDHGLEEHDYPLWLERWSKLLALADNVSVQTSMGFPSDALLAAADVTVFYSNNVGWDLRAALALDRYQQRGGGLVYVHYAIEGHHHTKELADRIGLAFRMSAFRHGEMMLEFTPTPHPITDGFSQPIRFIDETYWKLHGDASRLHILGTSHEEGHPTPQLWAREQGRSRTVGCIPGHYTWTFDDPLFRILVLRSICWAAHEPDAHRLSELSTIGAR